MKPSKRIAATNLAKDIYREMFADLPLWRWPLVALVLLICGLALAVCWAMFWAIEQISRGRP
jgi:hypothetical protein